jgi:hypothetical protein
MSRHLFEVTVYFRWTAEDARTPAQILDAWNQDVSMPIEEAIAAYRRPIPGDGTYVMRQRVEDVP